jgi:signal transduction histidine kinase
LRVDASLREAHLSGDPNLVERLAANLVDNAVRHNHLDGGRISVATATVEGRAVLRVANTGAVLPPGDIDRLFEPFQRCDAARAVRSDGVGLGLSIVRAIAAAHGATISTEAPSSGGLAIEVTFPAP